MYCVSVYIYTHSAGEGSNVAPNEIVYPGAYPRRAREVCISFFSRLGLIYAFSAALCIFLRLFLDTSSVQCCCLCVYTYGLRRKAFFFFLGFVRDAYIFRGWVHWLKADDFFFFCDADVIYAEYQRNQICVYAWTFNWTYRRTCQYKFNNQRVLSVRIIRLIKIYKKNIFVDKLKSMTKWKRRLFKFSKVQKSKEEYNYCILVLDRSNLTLLCRELFSIRCVHRSSFELGRIARQ